MVYIFYLGFLLSLRIEEPDLMISMRAVRRFYLVLSGLLEEMFMTSIHLMTQLVDIGRTSASKISPDIGI
jgi:hypothetical protein